ncbi:hypothetical protein ACFXTH_036292 [Malus domestica]
MLPEEGFALREWRSSYFEPEFMKTNITHYLLAINALAEVGFGKLASTHLPLGFCGRTTMESEDDDYCRSDDYY